MSTIANLRVVLSASTDQFTSAMKGVGDQVRKVGPRGLERGLAAGHTGGLVAIPGQMVADQFQDVFLVVND